MSKTIDYAKISANLTPRERAKLVIKLGLKGMMEVYPDEDKPITTEAEIREVIAAAPTGQAREYNFYIELKDQVWGRLLPLLEYSVLELEIKVARFHMYAHMIAKDKDENSPLLDKKIITAFHEGLSKQLAEIANYKSVIERIQDEQFDGFQLMSDDPATPLGALPRVKAKVEDLIGEFNDAVFLASFYCKLENQTAESCTFQDFDLSIFVDPEMVTKKYEDTVFRAKEKN